MKSKKEYDYTVIFEPATEGGYVVTCPALSRGISPATSTRIYFEPTHPEFTPRTTQTQDERAKLVFAIKVTISNADHALKPGMYADASITE